MADNQTISATVTRGIQLQLIPPLKTPLFCPSN